MYKKILSLCLVLLIAFSCVSISVSALTPSYESLFIAPFTEYLQQDGSSIDEEFLYIDYIGSTDKCDVYRAYYGEIRDVESQQIIGDYKFTYGSLVGDEKTNPTGLYAWDKFGFGILPLKEAYDKGYVDLDLLYETKDSEYGMYPLTEYEKEEVLKEKCKEAYVKEYGIDTDLLPARVEFAVQFENYVVFRASHIEPAQMHAYQYIYGCWFYEPHILGEEDDNPLGLYTLDNYGNVESLYNTAGKSFIDMEEIFPELSEKCNMYLLGDIDSDKRLTVKDATLIQKYLAKIPEAVETVNAHVIGQCVMETDQPLFKSMYKDSSDVNVKDATYIQKKLAKLVKDYNKQEFAHDAISVSIWQKEVKEYTPEDFPEFEVEKIVRFDSSMLEMTSLTVYLKNPGKSNVINAVNSLEYRKGTEFDYVNACYAGTDA
ncbi:MAG: hypothetical protein IJF19_01950 [Clostridia bacterium]|nr:hypothetical protein [Clostridia bacterium]